MHWGLFLSFLFTSVSTIQINLLPIVSVTTKNNARDKMQKTIGLAINFIGFQIGWFVCVIGAAKGLPVVSVVCALLIVAYHLYRSHSITELYIVMVAMLIGFVWEWLREYKFRVEANNYQKRLFRAETELSELHAKKNKKDDVLTLLEKV